MGGAAPAGTRLHESRERADHARERSRELCERAGAEASRARVLRTRSSAQARSWREWHRLWRRVVLWRDPLTQQPAARALVRVCMYCARVYIALPLARGIDEVDRSWRAVPPWVRDRLGSPAFRVIPSHGACPSCAQRHMDDW